MIRLNNKNLNKPKHYDSMYAKRLRTIGLDYSNDRRFENMLKEFKGGKFLDVGCGVSPLALKVSKTKTADVWALDFIPDSIEILKKMHPDINYVVADVREKLPFKANTFDYITAGEIMEHMESPKKFLRELFRILKFGGFLSISTPFEEGYSRISCSQEHIWGFTIEDIADLLSKFGDTEAFVLWPNKEEEKRGEPPFIIGHCKKT